MLYRSVAFLLLILIFAGLLSSFSIESYAFIDACSGSVSPTSLVKNSSTSLSFTVTNDSSEDAHFIAITAANADLAITAVSGNGWTVDYLDAAETYLSGGTITAGNSSSFTVSVTTADVERSAESWEVKLDSDPAGSDPTICSGSFSTDIIVGDGTAPSISGITVANISTTQATITWTTDEASTSVVEYGTSTLYGTTTSDSTLTTSHSVTLTGLSAGTTYNYRVRSADSGNNSAESGNNTFATSVASSSSSSSSSSSTSTSTSTTTTTATTVVKPKDTTAPSVTITSGLATPFKDAPIIQGSATDQNPIQKITYSIDQGGWINVPISQVKNRVSYSFTPPIHDDGNYEIQVRAQDEAGNYGYSSIKTLIIDRIPPRIGGIIHTIGPIVLDQNEGGEITALVGAPQNITLSSVGGAISIDILATHATNKTMQTFSLTKSKNTGLWSGTLVFEQSGKYELRVGAVDGVKNAIDETIGTVLVAQRGLLRGGSFKNGEVSVYYFDSIHNNYFLWQAESYSQNNPQKIDQHNEYAFFLPAGKYYLEVVVDGYKLQRSEIFSLEKPTIINSDFTLEITDKLKLGPITLNFPDLAPVKTVPLSLKRENETNSVNKLVLPEDFKFVIDQRQVSQLTLRGKPSVIGILNSWHPSSSIQIEVLERLASSRFNILVVLPNESVSSVEVFRARGGYSIPMAADPDGEFINSLSVHSFPMYILLDRKGAIVNSGVGILQEKDVTLMMN